MSVAVTVDIINGTPSAENIRHSDGETVEQVNILVLSHIQPYTPVLSVLLVFAKLISLIRACESLDKLSGL